MKAEQDIIDEILSSIKLSHSSLEKIADQATKPIYAIDLVNDLANMGIAVWYDVEKDTVYACHVDKFPLAIEIEANT